jgi:hypothetical protein
MDPEVIEAAEIAGVNLAKVIQACDAGTDFSQTKRGLKIVHNLGRDCTNNVYEIMS